MKRFEWLVQYRAYAFGFLALFFFLWGLGGWELSAPDEPRYALVAQEMMQTGDFLFPHRNQVPYPDKPPLFFWGIAAASYFQGGEVTAFSSRLPSALAGLGCLLILGAWSSQRGKNPQMGFWTVAVLATSFRFFFQAHMAQIDMTLCLITTAATLYGFRSFEGRPVRRWFLGVLLGLGILAKGPVGYLIPAGIWALYCLFSGRTSWKFYPAKALLWGLVPPLIWLIGLGTEVAIRGEWAYFENLVFKQTLVRYVNPWHHYKPFYYFVQVFFQDFFPWSFFVVLLIPFRRELIAHLSDRQRLAWSAILFVLVFFSLSKGKRNV